MQYSVKLRKAAQKQLEELPDGVYSTVWRRMVGLGEDPRPPGALKLASADLWRIRAGRYRVIYAINDSEQEVTVVRVARRSEGTYRGL
ncbi:MAG: type II toxin-antitoxin system RelE/ParE family toxin [Dehalococcoidia bacterium]|nr:type II toxin-antitoxin system RelE/ParE family toxin [Dehalococcoidia bacterium]